MYHNSVDITTFDGYLLRIDCNKAEDGLRINLSSECALNALAIDEPLEYARLVLDGNLQMWVDAKILWNCGKNKQDSGTAYFFMYVVPVFAYQRSFP